MREETPFKAGAAIVPVTNLVFRLSLKGPSYQRSYATEPSIGGLPFEKPDEYIKRSPLYHVEQLHVPILVHVATNDLDVNYAEDQQLVWKLRALKPDLAETKIYVDPVTLERVDSPEQIDSWNRTWVFFEWWLRSRESGIGNRESGIAGTGNGEPRLRVESLFPVPGSQARAKRATDSLFPIPDSRFPIPYVPGSAT